VKTVHKFANSFAILPELIVLCEMNLILYLRPIKKIVHRKG